MNNHAGLTLTQPTGTTFSHIRRRKAEWSSHVVILQRTSKKCTKIQNARAQLLFFSLYLLFGDVLIAVVFVLIGTLRKTRRQRQRERHQTIGLMSKTMAVHVHYNSWYTF